MFKRWKVFYKTEGAKMRRTLFKTFVLCGLLLAAGPATRSIRTADEVETYFWNQVKLAQKERSQSLQTLKDHAMKANDLNGAVALQKKIDEAQTFAPPAPAISARRLLESRIAGTSWHRYDVNEGWIIKADGTVLRSDGRVGQWSAVSPQTILIYWNNGEEDVDRWKFSDDLKSFDDMHAALGGAYSAKRVSD